MSLKKVLGNEMNVKINTEIQRIWRSFRFLRLFSETYCILNELFVACILTLQTFPVHWLLTNWPGTPGSHSLRGRHRTESQPASVEWSWNQTDWHRHQRPGLAWRAGPASYWWRPPRRCVGRKCASWLGQRLLVHFPVSGWSASSGVSWEERN